MWSKRRLKDAGYSMLGSPVLAGNGRFNWTYLSVSQHYKYRRSNVCLRPPSHASRASRLSRTDAL